MQEFKKETSEVIRYMGLDIPKSSLPSRAEVIDHLGAYGALDNSLDRYRSAFHDVFGKDLIWRYTLSGETAGGTTIVPVREGFLLLHYKEVFKDSGAHYILKDAEMLTADGANTFLREGRSYMDDLCHALADMELILTDAPEVSYVDAEGNLYFVRGGIGEAYKGFKRYSVPRKGRRETGLRNLLYRKDRAQAQRDLDEYARTHGLTTMPGTSASGVVEMEGGPV